MRKRKFKVFIDLSASLLFASMIVKNIRAMELEAKKKDLQADYVRHISKLSHLSHIVHVICSITNMFSRVDSNISKSTHVAMIFSLVVLSLWLSKAPFSSSRKRVHSDRERDSYRTLLGRVNHLGPPFMWLMISILKKESIISPEFVKKGFSEIYLDHRLAMILLALSAANVLRYSLGDKPLYGVARVGKNPVAAVTLTAIGITGPLCLSYVAKKLLEFGSFEHSAKKILHHKPSIK